jgi:hypothetical protein
MEACMSDLSIHDFWQAALVAVALISISTIIFYEILAHVWVRLPRFGNRHRLQILFTVGSCFVGHTLAVWLFGSAYYVLDKWAGFGTLKGEVSSEFLEYVYFSGVTYSSLGLGDVYPTGGLQLLIGVEAILGLILIGWTITFTYIVTEKYLFHRRDPKKH